MNKRAQIRRLTVGIATLTVVSLAAAACGSSNDGSGTSSMKDSIKVMTIAPSGTQVVNFDTAEVVEAYAEKLNSDGGINGKHVHVVACNDKFDPNEATNCARKAVQEKVVAVVGGFSAFDDQILGVLEQAGIPYIANTAVSAKDLTSKVSFPILAGPVGFAALGGYAAQTCETTTAILLDVPAAAAILPFAEKALGAAGKKLGSPVKVSQTTVDFSSAAKALGAFQCAVVALPSASVAALIAAMAQLDVKTHLLTPIGAIDGPLLKKYGSNLEGSITLSQFAPLEDKSWDAAKKAISDQEVLTNVIVQNSWVGMVVFDQVVRGITGTVDAKSVLAAMSKADAVDTDGLSPTLTFTNGLPVPQLARVANAKIAIELVKGGKLVRLGDYTDLAAALAG